MSKVAITYRKNPLYSEHNATEQPRLFAQLDLREFGVDTQVRNLAIYYKRLEKPVGPIRVVYTTNLAGLSFEAGNLTRLKQIIDDTLKALIRFERLPEYFFSVGENAYPIYHLPGQLLTRYPGGLVFSDTSIARLRVAIADHFKSLGRIRNRHEMGLLYLSPYDLQLYEPQCVVRIPDESQPDIPVFPDPNEGQLRLVAPVNSISLNEAYDEGRGVFAIHKAVEKYLIDHNQLAATDETTVRKLKAGNWEKIQKELTPFSQVITYKRDLGKGETPITQPIYSVDDKLVTPRVNRLGGVVLTFATSTEVLQKRVGADLSSYGAIDSPDLVAIAPMA